MREESYSITRGCESDEGAGAGPKDGFGGSKNNITTRRIARSSRAVNRTRCVRDGVPECGVRAGRRGSSSLYIYMYTHAHTRYIEFHGRLSPPPPPAIVPGTRNLIYDPAATLSKISGTHVHGGLLSRLASLRNRPRTHVNARVAVVTHYPMCVYTDGTRVR